MFGKLDYDGHERVVFAHDEATGLKAIIALHSTRLGPAFGGCRMWPYEDDEHALTDALRLSRGMTYKAAICELPYGGGNSQMAALILRSQRCFSIIETLSGTKTYPAPRTSRHATIVYIFVLNLLFNYLSLR